MKTHRHLSYLALFGLLCASPFAFGETLTETKTVRRVVSSTEVDPATREPVSFLGVETVPANDTLVAQLGLAKGVGLVVRVVVPNSAASEVLKPHDILIKLNDQLLIETRQLGVLIRSYKPGEEITLTYVRGGKEATGKVKLRPREKGREMGLRAPKAEGDLSPDSPEPAMAPQPPMPPDVLAALRADGKSSAGKLRFFSQSESGLVEAGTEVRPDNSRLVLTDDEGTLDLELKDGKKLLLAKDPSGTVLFEGAIDTPEQRKALPKVVKKRLEQMEQTDHLTFQRPATRSFRIPAPQVMEHRFLAEEDSRLGPAL